MEWANKNYSAAASVTFLQLTLLKHCQKCQQRALETSNTNWQHKTPKTVLQLATSHELQLHYFYCWLLGQCWAWRWTSVVWWRLPLTNTKYAFKLQLMCIWDQAINTIKRLPAWLSHKLCTHWITKYSQECQRSARYHQAWRLCMEHSDLDTVTVEDYHSSSFSQYVIKQPVTHT